MTCELDRSQLSAYVDQELTADQRAAVEAHLATCSECRAELAGLGWLVQKLRALPEIEPPDGFSEALRRRLLAEADAAGSDGPGGAPGPVAVRAATLAAPVAWWRRTAPVAAAAVVALAVGFGSAWALWGPGPGPNAAMARGPQRTSTLQAQQGTPGGKTAKTMNAASPEQATPSQSSSPDGSGAGAAGSGGDAATTLGTMADVHQGNVGTPMAASTVAPVPPVPERPRLVRSGRVDLQVTSFAAAYTQALQLIALNGGEVVQGRYTKDEAGGANLDVRVPADRLDSLLASLTGIGSLRSLDVESTDVSAQLRALDQRLSQPENSPEKGLPSVDTGSMSGDVPVMSGTPPSDAAFKLQAQRDDLIEQVNWASLTISLSR